MPSPVSRPDARSERPSSPEASGGPALRRVVALLVVVAAAAWMAPISASAGGVSQARSELQRARAQLRALDVRLSILAQRIHEGKVLLRTLRSDLAAATGRTARARAAAKEASAELE